MNAFINSLMNSREEIFESQTPTHRNFNSFYLSAPTINNSRDIFHGPEVVDDFMRSLVEKCGTILYEIYLQNKIGKHVQNNTAELVSKSMTGNFCVNDPKLEKIDLFDEPVTPY